MYGFSAVICYTALKPFENSKLILFIGSTLILSALMVVVGVLVEKLSNSSHGIFLRRNSA